MGKVEVVNRTKYRVLSRAFLENLLEFVLREEKKEVRGQVVCAFLDEESMREVKRKFFNVDEVGDVVSFFYGEDPDGVWGEILVCVPVALEASNNRGVPLSEELAFLVIHGLLHLLGYDDSTPQGHRQMMERGEALLRGYQRERTHQELLKKAAKARAFAYAPYSSFRVGAALLARDGRVFTGCNVENASFGVTLCAERVALGKAISEGAKEFEAIAIVANGTSFCFPCGVCRQALAEFGLDIEVLAGNQNGAYVVHSLRELLPHTFTFAKE